MMVTTQPLSLFLVRRFPRSCWYLISSASSLTTTGQARPYIKCASTTTRLLASSSSASWSPWSSNPETFPGQRRDAEFTHDSPDSRPLVPTTAYHPPIRPFLLTRDLHFVSSSSLVCRSFSSSSSTESSSSTPVSSENNHDSSRPLSISILYATTGGTAQLFATQLADAIEEQVSKNASVEVSVQSLEEYCSLEQLLKVNQEQNNSSPQYCFFLVSTTGVGEPPAAAKPFYDDLLEQATPPSSSTSASNFRFAIFGLGNQKAHPNHYNVVGKTIQSRFDELLADFSNNNNNDNACVLPLTLGDDGDCIDDDFDQWQTRVVEFLQQETELLSSQQASSSSGEATKEEESPSSSRTTNEQELQQPSPTLETTESPHTYLQKRPCPGAVSGERIRSKKYPFLIFQQETATTNGKSSSSFDLLDRIPDWYPRETQRYRIVRRSVLNLNGVANGLTELEIALPNNNNVHSASSPSKNNHHHDDDTSDSCTSSPPPLFYESGDHFVIHPRNADCVVEAYLNYFQMKPNAVIIGQEPEEKEHAVAYPHPTSDLSLYETLSYCVDLGATPSPALVRLLTNLAQEQQQQHNNNNNNNGTTASTTTAITNYKEQVAVPRRTVLDLVLELNVQLSLEDFLYNVPPMQPRYYSIASSPLRNNNKNTNNNNDSSKHDARSPTLLLTYRPIRYLTNRGVLREGICTSYMNHLTPPPPLPLGVGTNTNVDNDLGSAIVGAIRSNPSFRLPTNLETSVVFIAGGCGVAPVRAFLEERLLRHEHHQQKQQGMSDEQPPLKFGPAYLFLGFRDVDDVAYADLIRECLQRNVLTQAFITTAQCDYRHGGSPPAVTIMNDNNDDKKKKTNTPISWSCGNVTDSFHTQAQVIWNHFEQGGHTYICGGARSFGAAVGAEVVDLIQTQGHMSTDQATSYLRQMVIDGRFAEDLSD